MIKKIVIILVMLVVILAIAFMVVVKKMNPDQTVLQYDKEVITEYKRVMDFSNYDLEDFQERYDVMLPLVHEKSVETIQAQLQNGDYTCEELAKFYVKRIKDNEEYNAVIQLNPKLLEEAREVDIKIANHEEGQLAGVLVLIKDNIGAVNMNTSAGAYVLKDAYTSRDASLVEKLKTGDCLIIGKANLSEWSK